MINFTSALKKDCMRNEWRNVEEHNELFPQMLDTNLKQRISKMIRSVETYASIWIFLVMYFTRILITKPVRENGRGVSGRLFGISGAKY